MKTRRAISILASTEIVFAVALLTFIFVAAAIPITDTDFWWHLRTGKYIVETRSIPHTDPFSTVRFGYEWVTHEWLSEVITFLIYRAWSFGGVIVVFSLIISLVFLVAYLECRRRSESFLVTGISVFLGAWASMPTWGVRPHVFSLLFTIIFLALLNRYLRRELKISIWWLVPLFVLWVNLHAGFVLGIGLIGLTVVGLLLDQFLLPGEIRHVDWRRGLVPVLVLVSCVFAIAINPNSTRLYSYPFETLTSPAMMRYIQEWRSPDFHDPRFQALAVLLLLTVAALALSKKRVRPSELLIFVAMAWATLRSVRNVSYFAFVAMPLLAEHSSDWISSFRRPDPGRTNPKITLNRGLTARASINVVLVLTLIVLAVNSSRRSAAAQLFTDAKLFPVNAVDYLQSQKVPQPIFNEYDWGGYLIWRLYPDFRVFIDGRADVYGDFLVEKVNQVNGGRPGWNEFLSQQGVQTTLLRPDAPLTSLLRQDVHWKVVFEDDVSIVFTRIHR